MNTQSKMNSKRNKQDLIKAAFTTFALTILCISSAFAIDVNRVGKILDQVHVVESATIQVLPSTNNNGTGKITLRCEGGWCDSDYTEANYGQFTEIVDLKGNIIPATDLLLYTGKAADVSIVRGGNTARTIRIYK